MRYAQLSKVKHRVSVGQPLPFNVRNADKTLLLARGRVVDSFEQMEALFERGAVVDVAELRSPIARILDAPAELLPELWDHCMDMAGQTLTNSSEPGFSAAVDEVTEPVLALIERDSDLAIFQVLRQPDNAHTAYGLNHSVHAAITAHLVAQRLGWQVGARQTTFKAALTMNLSMLELQGQLATQTTPLTAAQRSALVAHPQGSVSMLELAGITDADWLRTVAEHHEVPNGSGYPRGLREVGEIASLVHRADVYTAKLSSRKGRDAMAADRAGREMFMQDPGHPAAAALAKEFGVYPPGCYVKLVSGEMGVVIKRGPTVTTPKVAALTSPAGENLREPEPRDTSRREHAIAGVVSKPDLRKPVALKELMKLALA